MSRKLAKFTNKEIKEFRNIIEIRIAVNARIWNRLRVEKDWKVLECRSQIISLFDQIKNETNIEIDSEKETDKLLEYYKSVVCVFSDIKEVPTMHIQCVNSFKKINEVAKGLSDNDLRNVLKLYNIGAGNENPNNYDSSIVQRYHCFYNGRRIVAKPNGIMLRSDLNTWSRNELILGLWFARAFHNFEKNNDNSLLDLLRKNNFVNMNEITYENKVELIKFMENYDKKVELEEYGN